MDGETAMDKKLMIDYYNKLGYNNIEIEIAISAVENLELKLEKIGKTPKNVNVDDIKKHLKDLINKGEIGKKYYWP